jgi:hypothetical protein
VHRLAYTSDPGRRPIAVVGGAHHRDCERCIGFDGLGHLARRGSLALGELKQAPACLGERGHPRHLLECGGQAGAPGAHWAAGAGLAGSGSKRWSGVTHWSLTHPSEHLRRGHVLAPGISNSYIGNNRLVI